MSFCECSPHSLLHRAHPWGNKGQVKPYWWLFWDIFSVLGYWSLVSSTVSMIICLVRPAGVPRARVISGGLYLLLTQVPTDNDNKQSYQNSRWLSPGKLALLKQCDSGEGICLTPTLGRWLGARLHITVARGCIRFLLKVPQNLPTKQKESLFILVIFLVKAHSFWSACMGLCICVWLHVCCGWCKGLYVKITLGLIPRELSTLSFKTSFPTHLELIQSRGPTGEWASETPISTSPGLWNNSVICYKGEGPFVCPNHLASLHPK